MDFNIPNINKVNEEDYQNQNNSIQLNTIYSDLENNDNCTPSQLNENNQNRFLENNNIYSETEYNNGYNSNISANTNNKPYDNIYTSNNTNIYTSSENNTDFYEPLYNPDFNTPSNNEKKDNNNLNFLPKTNNNTIGKNTNHSNNNTPSLQPLISTSNRINTGGNCCTRIDTSIPDLQWWKILIIIILSIGLIVSSIINCVICIKGEPDDIHIIIIFDVIFILYSILVMFSVLRIKRIRDITACLSLFFLLGSVFAMVKQEEIMDKIKETEKKFMMLLL